MTANNQCDSSKLPVLCIGAGVEQLPAIEIAQQMNLHVTAIDGNPEAPGLSLADHSQVVDLRDTDAVIRFAHQIAPRAILPVPLGSIISTVGVVNDALGLCGISATATSLCTDKQKLATTLEQAGLFTPRSLVAEDAAAILPSAESLGWPVILKPIAGSGSRGVVACQQADELLQWLPWHLQQRQADQTVVQQFIPGLEVGVDGVMLDGELKILMIRDKEITAAPFRLPFAFLAPAQLETQQEQCLEQTLATACRALALNHCLVHADVILTEQGQAVVVDISGRPSGFHISAKMAPSLLGFNPLAEMIRYQLGERANFQARPAGATILRFLSAPAGTFLDIQGLPAARHLPGIVAAESFLEPGETILPRRCGRSGYRVGYLMAHGSTRQEAENYWQAANQTIHFHVEQNDDCHQQCTTEQTQLRKHGVWCQDTTEQYPQLSD